MPGIPSALASLGVGQCGMAAAAAAASRLGLSGLAHTAGQNVLLVSNLNPQVSTLSLYKQLQIPCLSVQCLVLSSLFKLCFMDLDPFVQ